MTNQELRKAIKQQRRALTGKHRDYQAFLASLHLTKLLPRLPKQAKIGIYLDAFGEIPTLRLIKFCQKHRFTPYLPITKPDKPLSFAPMTAYRIDKTPLLHHKLGMSEPRSCMVIDANRLDVIICPLIAVDIHGNRLGMGGGFYDRTFKQTRSTLKIGWCYDFQVVTELSTNTWDMSVDAIICPSRAWWV